MRKYLLLAIIPLMIWACKSEDDNGSVPTVTGAVLNIINYDIIEGTDDKFLNVRVGFKEAVSNTTVLTYELVDGTAVADEDYEAIAPTQLVFNEGESNKDIRITIIGDLLFEETETFQVRLFSTAGSFDENSTTITILDDDTSIEDLVIPGGETSPTSYPGMELIWSDEFQGESLNEDDWTFEIGNGCPNLCGWGNNELEFYQRDNITFRDNDYLIIEARPEQVGSNQYTSSRIITRDKVEFKYGRVDIRAVLPEGRGIWPALWMLGANINEIGWPACGEIDIMELIGSDPSTVHGTFHYGNSFAEHTFEGSANKLTNGEKFRDQFHIFSLIWEEDHVQVLRDNQLVHEIRPENTEPQNYPFNEDFFFIFNVAVGGNWPGAPTSTTPFPQHMIVDYIRVFQ